MMPQVKNAIIFISIAVVLVLAYIFLIKGEPESENLVSSSDTATTATDSTIDGPTLDRDFLPLLLSVKSIKLNDGIFSDPAFMALTDSSIVLVPDDTEGRPNPFAPLGSENTPLSSEPN